MLAQWIENRRAARQHWRGVLAALAYPLFAVAAGLPGLLLFALLVVPPFRSMFEEFGLKLPLNTVAVLWLCDAGSRLLISFALVAGIALDRPPAHRRFRRLVDPHDQSAAHRSALALDRRRRNAPLP